MKKFEVGKVYWMFSPAQQSCTWEYKVVGRTNKMISLQPLEGGETKRCKVSVDMDEEWAKPLGSYSMCPMLRAGREK